PASPEVQSAPDVQLAPEFSAADAATFWDETIYAPVAPVPTADEEAPEPAVVDDDAGVEFAPVSNGVEPEAAPDGDPLEVWAGCAEAPAQSDGNGWGTLVDASLDEVFGQRAEPDPDPPPNPDPEEEAPTSLAAVAAEIIEAPDAGDPAAVAPTDDTPSP